MENLYKFVLNKYFTTVYKNTVKLPVPVAKISDKDVIFSLDELHPQDYYYRTITKWEQSHTSETKEDYLENYGNKLSSIYHRRFMVVVEKNDDKVSLKLFHYERLRKVGTPYFKISTSVNFLTYNFKTNSLYDGFMNNYHKKRKFVKRVRRTPLYTNPIGNFKTKLEQHLPFYGAMSQEWVEERNKTIDDVISAFIKSIPSLENYPYSIYGDYAIVKMILDRRSVKLPDNWKNLITCYPQPKAVHLKKNKMKYVDALMMINTLNGDKVRKVIHKLQSFNPYNFHSSCSFFGKDFILSQTETDIQKIFEYGTALSFDSDSKKFSGTKTEIKKLYQVLKLLLDGVINHHTFFDHINFYNRLKFLEPVKWNSSDYKSFINEHLEWTELLDFYTKGDYRRIYDQRFVEKVEKPILLNGIEYFPLILKTSKQYNDESLQQSNCVKGYVGRASSLIISLRKNSIDSTERATIEFLISKTKESLLYWRIQTLGRFNKQLDSEWDEVLERLDTRLDNLSMSMKDIEDPSVLVRFGHKFFEAKGIFTKEKFNAYRTSLKGGIVMTWDKDIESLPSMTMNYNVREPQIEDNGEELYNVDLLPDDIDLY